MPCQEVLRGLGYCPDGLRVVDGEQAGLCPPCNREVAIIIAEQERRDARRRAREAAAAQARLDRAARRGRGRWPY
jgi:hypothetical protein